MKKLLFSLFCLGVLALPATGISSYQIELKNGSTFFTYRYWEEGGQVMFYAHGGVLGVEKDAVKRIEESDLPYLIREKPEPSVKEEPPREEGEKEKAVADTGGKQTLPLADVEAMMKEKKGLDAEIAEATSSFNNAKAEGDPKRIESERKRISSALYRKSRLLKKARESSGGDLPEWWNQ